MTTKIPWAHETVNIMSGCSGPNGTPDAPKPCSYCYAHRMAKRLQRMPQSAHKYRHGFRPTFHPDEIRKFRSRAAGWRKPRRVFVGSMGDIMDPGFDDEQIREVIRVAVAFPQHSFIFLSKRPWRYADFIWPRNSWLGTTVTNQKDLEERAIHLLGPHGHSVSFFSVEPILGPIVLGNHKPDWVIIGSQTGLGALPPDRQWVMDLIGRAKLNGAAVFCKPSLEKHFGDAFTQREFPG